MSLYAALNSEIRCVLAVSSLVLTFQSGGAWAQGACGLAPDRPGATNGYNALEPGCFQFELSTEVARADSVTAQSFPTALRLGAVEGLEVRLETAVVGLDYSSNSDDRAQRTDIGLGLKKELVEPSGGTPGLGFTLLGIWPGGSDDAGDIIPRFDLLADWGFGDWAVSLNAGVLLANDNLDERQFGLPFGAVLGYSLPGTEGRWSMFVDSSAEATLGGPDDGWVQAVGGGVVYMATPTLQLDVSGSADVVGDSNGWWAAVGASFAVSL